MASLEAREAHRKAHNLPGPITQTDQLLLALHHEVHLLRLALAPEQEQAPLFEPEAVELREPAMPTKPTKPTQPTKQTKPTQPTK